MTEVEELTSPPLLIAGASNVAVKLAALTVREVGELVELAAWVASPG
jgi:hypothetical protein